MSSSKPLPGLQSKNCPFSAQGDRTAEQDVRISKPLGRVITQQSMRELAEEVHRRGSTSSPAMHAWQRTPR
jgi:hypothetical protein